MIVITTDTVPNRVIESVLGVVTGMSGIGISSDDEAEAGQHHAMLNMMNAAAERGAHAVVGYRTSSSSYEERGSKWMKAKISCTGTAVRLRA